MELNNKTIVITGVSKGIGLALAKQLIAKGAIVFGLGRNQAEDFKHPNFHFINCDVRNSQSVQTSFTKIYETKTEIHGLINNAGLGYFGYLEDMPESQWDEMFQTNINGMFYCIKQVLPQMKKDGFGHIINIASTAALEGMAMVSGYCATKWAVKGLSESLFKEVRDFGVKVTCVYPGSTKTDFFRNSPGIQPHDYMLMPEDVALLMVQALEMPQNIHTVNLEIRPLQVRGPKK
ncbi:MAG: SDR family oxidoreductase [Bacteroidia bacterium]|nr:SDR family oxidoreductase [Bacteroidia bacterium]MCF8427552.1 SDR family oxidoreductase [Bacteroidia bacterium]MCF8447899.1 SDR family oxidoreductase [Bacteroidia bacterium]